MGGLRALTVTQQVGLLFVTLFGVLLLVTLVAFARSLRESHRRAAVALPGALSRDLRAVWVGALLFWIAWASGPFVSTLLFGVVSFLALREFVTPDAHPARRPSRPAARVLRRPAGAVRARRHAPVQRVHGLHPGLRLLRHPGDQRPRQRPAALPRAHRQDPVGHRGLRVRHEPRAGAAAARPAATGRSAARSSSSISSSSSRWRSWRRRSASRKLRRRPVARAISRSFSWRAWGAGAGAAALVGTLLFWTTPFKPLEALAMGPIAGGAGTLGEFVMKALKRDAGVRNWRGRAVGHRRGRPARPRRAAVLRRAGLLPLGALVLRV